MKDFKLIVTVGPKSIDKKILNGLLEAGADCFRINLSHSDEINFHKYTNHLNNANIKPSIDTQGAQGRVTESKSTKDLREGESVLFGFQNSLLSENFDNILILNHKEIIEQVEKGDIMRIDFSGLIIRIESIDKANESFTGIVVNSGSCAKNRAFDIASKPLILESHTEFDRWAIEQSKQFECPAIFHSFAETPEDINKTRKLCNNQSKIIAKIESKRGLKKIKEIAEVADGILVDRGDLSREISISMIPVAVNICLNVAKEIGKPIYIATNVLDSMMTNPLPSRAEISDIYNLMTNGVSGMVLAAEAAIGERPIESAQVISHMQKIVDSQKLGILGILNNDDIKSNMYDELQHWL